MTNKLYILLCNLYIFIVFDFLDTKNSRLHCYNRLFLILFLSPQGEGLGVRSINTQPNS